MLLCCHAVRNRDGTTWLEYKAITWLNARFPVRAGHSPTQLPVDSLFVVDTDSVDSHTQRTVPDQYSSDGKRTLYN